MALYLGEEKIAAGSSVNITILDSEGHPVAASNAPAMRSVAMKSNSMNMQMVSAPFIDFKSELSKRPDGIASGKALDADCFVSACAKSRGVKYQFAVDDVVIAE